MEVPFTCFVFFSWRWYVYRTEHESHLSRSQVSINRTLKISAYRRSSAENDISSYRLHLPGTYPLNMTRYTNFARKRTHEQASTNYREPDASKSATQDVQEHTSESRALKKSRHSSPQANEHSTTLPSHANAEPSESIQTDNAAPSQPTRKKTHRAGKRVRGKHG